jgi:hypothetical protein
MPHSVVHLASWALQSHLVVREWVRCMKDKTAKHPISCRKQASSQKAAACELVSASTYPWSARRLSRGEYRVLDQSGVVLMLSALGPGSDAPGNQASFTARLWRHVKGHQIEQLHCYMLISFISS